MESRISPSNALKVDAGQLWATIDRSAKIGRFRGTRTIRCADHLFAALLVGALEHLYGVDDFHNHATQLLNTLRRRSAYGRTLDGLRPATIRMRSSVPLSSPTTPIITSFDARPTLTLPEGDRNALASLLTYYADHYRR